MIQTRLTKFFVGGLFLVVSIIVLYPVLMLLYGSVRSSAPGDAGFFTLQNYFDAYGDRETYRLFLNAVFIVGAVTLLSAAQTEEGIKREPEFAKKLKEIFFP